MKAISKVLSLCLLSAISAIRAFNVGLFSRNLFRLHLSKTSLSMSSSYVPDTISAPVIVSTDTLATLFARYKKLPVVKQRAVASIVGSAVADAATRPVHWLYDRAKLESIISKSDDSAFWPESLSPFYTLPTGRRSCYNDLGYVMLRSLQADPSTPFSQDAYYDSLKQLFCPPSEYADAMARRLVAYDPAKRLEDRQPVPGPWQQGAVTNLLKCLEEGRSPDGSPQSRESDGLCTTLPLIARLSVKYSGDDTAASGKAFVSQIRAAASIISSNHTAMTHALCSALILRRLISSGVSALNWGCITESVSTLSDHADGAFDTILFEEIRTELAAVRASFESKTPFVDACESYGKACAYPGAFQGASFALVTAAESATPQSFADIIRQVIRVGGCNCSRANMVGACLGAVYGFQEAPFSDSSSSSGSLGISTEWLMKTDKAAEIFDLALVKVGEV